ncbi:hypothetical protein [Sulfuritalea sp.]|uniref:hypothetical protein n=1 Tax=Sulfuritalea sp. TaxID=2480090 RepID=UPI001AC30E38|nr:hypothetical protein [Sulfuritalea sp.]MBN8474315.1 hypothetical protein [Sulfuritalea sp.]
MSRPSGFRARLACLAAIAGATAVAAVAAPLDMASIVVSKADSGVAPLAVFFDATGIKSPATERSFMEMDCSWNFGDDDKAAWRHGTGVNHRKNRAFGPVAAHVYETPGSYTPSVTCSEGGKGGPVTMLAPIVVEDPDAAYAGASTRCLSREARFDGCPAGAERVTDAAGDFAATIARDLRQGRRLLFNRGETWHTSGPAILNVNGPWTLGAYGSGAKPVVRWSGGRAILVVGRNGPNANRDARVMDLMLDGTNPDSPWVVAVDFSGGFDQVTFLRVDIERTNSGFVQSASKPNLAAPWDQFTVADSEIRPTQGGPGGNGMFLFSSRTAILGNLFDNKSVGEHNFRSMYWRGLVVSSNTFRNPNARKANLTLRGPTWYKQFGPLPPGIHSQHGVVSDNQFVGAPGVEVPVNTSIDSTHESRTRYLVVERNWWTGQVGTVTAMSLNSSFSAVRNNIIDLSAGAGGHGIEATNNNDTQSASRNAIYNNTIYANQSKPGHVRGVRMFKGALDTEIRNNLLYAPSARQATVVDAALGIGTIGASGTLGNSSDAQAKNVDPLFANASRNFSKPSDFRPGAGSYAIGGGVAVPARHDFFRKAQGTARDVGAVAH